jgi:outer membrane protein TolC
LTAAGLRIHAAKAALYPQVRLTGSAGRLSQDLEDLLDSKFSVWSLAANLLQPIFQGGRLRAGLELATARQKEALHFYSKTVLTAFSEVETALAAQKYLEQQKVALEGAVRQATAAERLAQDRYDAGLASYLLYLESQRQATAAKSQLLQIQLQQLNARVDLYLALGGNISDVAEI